MTTWSVPYLYKSHCVMKWEGKREEWTKVASWQLGNDLNLHFSLLSSTDGQ